MEIALWTAIGTSLGLIAKGVSAEKPVAPDELQARLEALTKELTEAKSKLRQEERDAKARAEAAEQQAEAVAEVTGVVKKRMTQPASVPQADIAVAATIWSRASTADIQEFARRRLAELRTPAAILVQIPTANTAGEPAAREQEVAATPASEQRINEAEETAAQIPQQAVAEAEQTLGGPLTANETDSQEVKDALALLQQSKGGSSSKPTSFDSGTGTAPGLPAQPGKPMVGGAVTTNRAALFERLQNKTLEYSPVTRSSLKDFHTRYADAWKLDNPGQELPAEEMLVPFANKVAEELNQIPIDRAAKQEAEKKRIADEAAEELNQIPIDRAAKQEAEKKRIADEAAEEARRREEMEAPMRRIKDAYTLELRLSNASRDVIDRKYDPTNLEIVDAMLRASDYLIRPSADARISEIRQTTGPIEILPYEFDELTIRYPDEVSQWKKQTKMVETRSGNQHDGYETYMAEKIIGWSSNNHIPGSLARERPPNSVYLDETTVDSVKNDVEQLINKLESFPVLPGKEEAPAAAAPAPASKSWKSRFSRPAATTEPAESEPAAAEIVPAAHNAILEEAPVVQKNAEAAIKSMKSSKSKLDAKIALLPTPHIYRGACAVKAVALRLSKLHEDVIRVLGKAAPVLKSDLAAYKKETKKLDVPIYDATLKPRTTTKEKELAEKQEIADDETERISGLAEGVGNQIRDLSLSKQGTLEAITSTKALKSLKAPNMTGGDMFDRTRDLYASLTLRIREISPLLAFVEGIGNGATEMMKMIDGIDRASPIPKEQWDEEKRRCDKEMKDVMTRVDNVIVRTSPVQADTSQQGMFMTENPLAVEQAKQDEKIQAAKVEADKLSAAYPKEKRELTASDLYTPNPLGEKQTSQGEAGTSPFFKTVADVQNWFNTDWLLATPEKRATLAAEREEAMAVLERAMTPSQRERALAKLAAKKVGGADESVTEEQKLAEMLYDRLSSGGSRKSTLKNRRRGKQTQNGRGTRRRKNRANRPHPNARRGTKVNAR